MALSVKARVIVGTGVSVFVLAFVFAAWKAAVGLYFNPEPAFDGRGDAYWKLLYLGKLASGQANYTFQQHDPHPERGWVPKPNLPRERTNERGHRALAPYKFRDDAFRVLILGDSFTFGSTVPDGLEWPSRLQARDERMQIINLGVGGYGVAQMYVTLRDEIAEYRPHAVVFAPITDDLNRSLLSFREYGQPRFVVNEKNELVAMNLPIPPIAEMNRRLVEQYGLWTSRRTLAEEQEALKERITSGALDEEWRTLNQRLMEEAAKIVKKTGAVMLLTHLATGLEIDPTVTWGTDVVDAVAVMNAAAESTGALVVRTRPAFIAAGRTWVQGHYGPEESDFAAGVIFEAITALPEWRNYVERTEPMN